MGEQKPLDVAILANEVELLLDEVCDRTEHFVVTPGLVTFYTERGDQKFHVTVKELTHG